MNELCEYKKICDVFSPATSGRSWTAEGVVSTRVGYLKLPRRRWSLPSSMDSGDLHYSSKPAPHLTSITHSYIVAAAVHYYWFFFSSYYFLWVLWFFFRCHKCFEIYFIIIDISAFLLCIFVYCAVFLYIAALPNQLNFWWHNHYVMWNKINSILVTSLVAIIYFSETSNIFPVRVSICEIWHGHPYGLIMENGQL